MGCFSYTCQLSGLPITSGNKAVIVPIIPKDNWYDNSEESIRKFGKSCFVSNDGPNVFFDELCFPIFGEYNDYGGLENIVKDDNTKVLEEFFGLKIEKIVSVLTDGRKDEFPEGSEYCDSVKILKKKNPRHMLLLRTSCVWINGDFYEEISNFEMKKQWFDKLDLGVHGLLTEIGFKLIKENKRKFDDNSEKNRYYKVYEKDGLTLNSDGNWIHISGGQGIYDLQGLKKYCKSKGVDIDISKIDKKGLWEQVYDYILPGVESLQNRDRWTTERVIRMLLGDEYKVHGITSKVSSKMVVENAKKLKKEKEEKGEKIDDNIQKLIDHFTELFDKNKDKEDDISGEITQFYFEKIKSNGNDFMRKNIMDWHKVKSYYYPTGRYLIPIGTGPQDGDYDKVKEVLELGLKTVNKIIDQRKKDGYYDDEDDE